MLSPEKTIQALEPYLTEARKTRIEAVICERLSSLHLAVESPSDIHNALAAVRSAEAFGIYHIHIIAPEGDVQKNNGVTKGSAYWVKMHWHENLDDFLKFLHSENILLAGAVVDADITISALPITQKICILFGNEHRGLSQKARENCKLLFKIPMYGMVESFNLSVAASISLYDLSSRKREFLSGKSDLNLQEQTDLRAHYYLQSVDQRLAQALLKK